MGVPDCPPIARWLDYSLTLKNGVGALCPLTVDRALEVGGLMRRAAGRTCATPTGVCGPGSNQLNPQIVCRKRGCPVSPRFAPFYPRINLHIGMSRQHLKILIVVEDGCVNTDCDGGDEDNRLAYERSFPVADRYGRGPRHHRNLLARVAMWVAMATSLRRSFKCRSSRAPASTSIRITSQVAISDSNSTSTRSQVGDRVSRRNSIHAEVSIRITWAGGSATRQDHPPSPTREDAGPLRR